MSLTFSNSNGRNAATHACMATVIAAAMAGIDSLTLAHPQTNSTITTIRPTPETRTARPLTAPATVRLSTPAARPARRAL